VTLARVTRLVGLTAAAAVAAAVTVPPAGAMAAAGSSTLAFDGPAAMALRQAGVKVAPVAPASGGARRVVLPVAAGLAGSETSLLRQRGAIRLRHGKSALSLTGLTLVLARRSRVEAKAGRERVELFRVLGGQRKVDSVAGSVRASGLRLKLTAAATRLFAERLGVENPGTGRFGTLSVRVSGLTAGGEPGSGEGGGKAEEAATCPLPSTAGPEPETPLGTMTRPLGAVEVLSASLDWHVRESFIRYIASGEGTSVSGGASADPPVVAPGTSTALSYVFHFPFASGWLDRGANAADPADDTALLSYGGALRFHYSAHEIDLTAADPEIEIDGGASRAIFSVAENGGAGERQVLVNLDLSRAAKISAAGNSYTYERVPGAIPSGTATSTFAGFYAPGTEFGCFTLSLMTAG